MSQTLILHLGKTSNDLRTQHVLYLFLYITAQYIDDVCSLIRDVFLEGRLFKFPN
jgi:hypothetical protein